MEGCRVGMLWVGKVRRESSGGDDGMLGERMLLSEYWGSGCQRVDHRHRISQAQDIQNNKLSIEARG